VIVEFDEEAPAMTFERYLKTGSGREFAPRHLKRRASRAGTVSSEVILGGR